MTRIRLFGFLALGLCVFGYAGMGLAILLGALDILGVTATVIAAMALGVLGEIGLWVAAGCLGLGLFQRRKALFERLFGRRAAA